MGKTWAEMDAEEKLQHLYDAKADKVELQQMEFRIAELLIRLKDVEKQHFEKLS